MEACLVYDPALAAYDLGAEHPLRPERFTLAVSLMEAYGLVAPPAAPGPEALDAVVPASASDAEIALVHDPAYMRAVKNADEEPAWTETARFGLGTADNPVFVHMHEASALVAGSTLTAVREVLSGRHLRAFSIAGGLHHAHRARASGFCVYNDAAIAIAAALEQWPDARVAYVDIDAHHGDGVQEAFYDEPRVLTLSLHETGERLFPGTGWPRERGAGAAQGTSVNVPLPEGATDECYETAFDLVVEPVVAAFHADVLVAQCGADAHHSDPLTTLGLTLPGYASLVGRIVALADDAAAGRLVACGGGGYSWQHVVPRCWTLVAAALVARTLPAELPETWLREVERVTGVDPPRGLLDDEYAVPVEERSRLVDVTRRTCEEVTAWIRS